MTTRTAAVAAVLGAVLLVAGCSGTATPVESPSASAESSPSASAESSPVATPQPAQTIDAEALQKAADEKAAKQLAAIEAADAARAAEAQDKADDAAVVAGLDLSTDAGLCAADAELTNLELNDALAPLLGFPAERDLRTFDQDEAIRAHKNAAFLRACPARAS